MSIDLEVGDLVSFNSIYNRNVPFPIKGVGIVSSLSTRWDELTYDVLFPIGKVYEMPRAWLIKVPVKHHACALEEEDMMWGDK